MRTVVQRTGRAEVRVNGERIAGIRKGLVLLVGIARGDTEEVARRMARKIVRLRIFEDPDGRMNLDIRRAGGSVLSVPQFTLLADTSSGNRPGFDRAASPEKALALWRTFDRAMAGEGMNVEEGRFAADMEVELVNRGPVTFCLEV